MSKAFNVRPLMVEGIHLIRLPIVRKTQLLHSLSHATML